MGRLTQDRREPSKDAESVSGGMPNRSLARALPLHHIQSIILIIYLNTNSPFINHIRMKQWFYKFLRKTTVLIDLNFLGILRIQSLMFQLPGKNYVCKDNSNVLFFQPNFAIKAAPEALLEPKQSQKVNGTLFFLPIKAVPIVARGLVKTKLEPQQMLIKYSKTKPKVQQNRCFVGKGLKSIL